jgi:DNA-binding MarR family transcriptional regulator
MSQGIEITRPPRRRAATNDDARRRQLLRDLLDELTSHSPADMLRYMRRWPTGPLSLVHLQVLTVLETDGSVPMGTLADSLDVSQASATGIVDRMEQRGLIERRRDDDDRRVIRVALTEAGTGLLAGVAAERRERLGLLLDELSDDELRGFLDGSRALRRARARLAARWAVPDASLTQSTTQIDEGSR